jgi:hypothetical protein
LISARQRPRPPTRATPLKLETVGEAAFGSQKSTWFECLQVMALYAIIGIVLYAA